MKLISKNIKIILPAFVFILLSVNAFAIHIESTIKIVKGENKVLTLGLESEKQTDIIIRISESYGAVLLQEEISLEKKYKRRYDLSNLPKGKYKVEIENNQYIREQIVEITFDKLEILDKEEVKIYKPNVHLKGNKILLNMLSKKDAKVGFRIYDVEGKLIYSDEIKNEMTIHKTFDISKLNKGKYSVYVSFNGKSFYKDIVL